MQRLEVLQAAGAGAHANEESLLHAVDRLHEEALDYALRMNQAIEANAGKDRAKRYRRERQAGLV